MNKKSNRLFTGIAWLSLMTLSVFGQKNNNQVNLVNLTDFTAFTNPTKSWQIVGDVNMDIENINTAKTSKGTGILFNKSSDAKPGNDLLFNLEHGDIDVEMDYMMALGSNSGIYLQGRYKIQLFDSWGLTRPTAADNGGIYERWDDNKPVGQQGFDGHNPRQNVTRAPGLWQHIKISFRAPRFDASGKKIENAKILAVDLNGVRVQDDVELSGPTRGALNNNEVNLGPLALQGNGTVAFRNIKYNLYDKQLPELLNLKYAVYKGKFDKEPDYNTQKTEVNGTSAIISSNVSQLQNDFLIHYTGDLKINESGEYKFNLSIPGGTGLLRINNKIVVPLANGNSLGSTDLNIGRHPFDLYYSKTMDWAKPGLGLSVIAPNVREYLVSDASTTSPNKVDPILIKPTESHMILRSFIDLKSKKRITHAVSVGSNKEVNYTYDTSTGMMVLLWRGGFLDATPMWHSRGDGSSKPTGFTLQFGDPITAIQKMSSSTSPLNTDTAGIGFRPKGYTLDKDRNPTFKYNIYGTTVTDVTNLLPKGQGIQRVIELNEQADNLYVLLATVDNIEEGENGWYLVDDKSYYLHIDEAGIKPIIKDVASKKQLLVPISKKISYSILF